MTLQAKDKQISASELRIGNLVKWFDDVITLDGVTNSYVTCEVPYWEVINPEQIEGLPLTSEWLERFHFLPTNNGGHYYEQAQYIIYHCKINKFSGRTAFGIATFDDEGNRNGFVNFAWEIQFVHQLQNLFYALTGTELTLKEKERGDEHRQADNGKGAVVLPTLEDVQSDNSGTGKEDKGN